VPSAKRERKRQGRAARQEAIRAAQKRRARQRQFVIFGLLLAAVFAIGIFAFRGGGDDDESVSATNTTRKAGAPASTDKSGCTPNTTLSFPKADEVIDPNKKYVAKVETDAGTFQIEFDAKRTPKTTNNFVFLAKKGFYNCVTFHRVIPDFVVQGGDPTGTGSGGPGYKFEDEALDGTTYAAGDIAMANSGPNTNGSQFFVVLSDNGAQSLLTGGGGVPKYTRFGRVTSGMEVLKTIEADGGTQQGNGTDIKKKHHIVKITIEES
jgi:cyclophilin family peptidyl-prolyl cis-trans isomerase